MNVFLKNITKPKLMLGLCFVTYCAIYLPFVLHGGIIIDDWGIIKLSNSTSSFYQNLTNWYPLFSNRPLAPFIITVTGRLFGKWATGYIITNLVTWLSAITLIVVVLKRHTNLRTSYFFFFIAIVPTIASTMIFSPGMQYLGTFSIFLWSLSIYFLDKYLSTSKKRFYLFTYILILCCFLIYEVVLPLMLITALLPLKYMVPNTRKQIVKYISKYILPLAVIMLGLAIMQKMILPMFTEVHSRINFISFVHCLLALMKFFEAVLIEFPFLLISGIQYFYKLPLVNIAIILFLNILFLVFLLKNRKYIKEEKNSFQNVALLLSFLACSMIYVINGSGAVVSGYDNRGLESTWILISALFAVTFDRFFAKKILGIICAVIFIVFVQLSFSLQIFNYNQSWAMQKEIITQCVSLSEKNPSPPKDILGDVPPYVTPNYNGEEVFGNSWDFGYALSLLSDNNIKSGMPINSLKYENNKIVITDNGIIIDEYRADINELWYFKYDKFGQSFLIKIKNVEQLKSIIESLKDRPVQLSGPQIITKKLHIAFKSVIEKYK